MFTTFGSTLEDLLANLLFIFDNLLLLLSGKFVRIVREHYLRKDISCQSPICTTCKGHETPAIEEGLPSAVLQQLSGPKDTSHYAVIELDTLVKYLELFE